MRLMKMALVMLPCMAFADSVEDLVARLPVSLDGMPRQIEEPVSAEDYFVVYTPADGGSQDAVAVSIAQPEGGPLSGPDDVRLTDPAAQAIEDLAREGETDPGPRQVAGAVCGDAPIKLEMAGEYEMRLASTCYAAVDGSLVVVSDNTAALPETPSQADLATARAANDARLATILQALGQ